MRWHIIGLILVSLIAIHRCQVPVESPEVPEEESPEVPEEESPEVPEEESPEVPEEESPEVPVVATTVATTRPVFTTTQKLGWNPDKVYKLNDDNYYYDNNDYDNGKPNRRKNYKNDDYDKDYESDKYRSKRRSRSPDSMGHMSIYFKDSPKHGKKGKPHRVRFPTARYERKRYPRHFGRLISFLPWVPIFADRLTKQTIIHSPMGGIYIIPPVINFYGELFSVAELIATGYASLVSSGAPPPPAVDVAPLVQPGAVVGPGIPGFDGRAGGFRGGVRTELRAKYPTRINDY